MDNQFEMIMTDFHQFKLENLNPTTLHLKPDEVLIRPHYVGICGSDLYLIHAGLKNLRLGHEWVGEIIKLGSKVDDFKVGSLVTGTGHFACGKCTYCQENRSNLCSQSVHFSSHQIGALRSAFSAPQSQVFLLKEPLDSALALIEVFAVGEQAYALIERQLKQFSFPTVLIFGAGPIGLAVAEVFKSYQIDFKLIEKVPFRVDNARKLGFDSIQLQEAILTDTLKGSFDVLVDCSNDYSGDSGAFKWLNFFSKKEFVALIVGKYITIQSLPPTFNSKAANLIWMRGVGNGILKNTIEKWQSKLSALKSNFISHEFGIEQTQEAFKTFENKNNAIKVIIKI